MFKQFNPDSPEFINQPRAGFFGCAESAIGGEGEAGADRLVKARKSATPPVERTELEIKTDFYRMEHDLHVSRIPFEMRKSAQEIAKASTAAIQWNWIDYFTKDVQANSQTVQAFRALDQFDNERTSTIGRELSAEEIEDRKKANQKQNTIVDNQKGAGRIAVIEKREWSDEYRIRTQVDNLAALPTPENAGARVTKQLTLRGARTIADSCEFMATCHGGYKTFLTLTMDAPARNRIATGESTIQKEVKRFFDGANKVFQRGFSYTNDKGEAVKVEPYHGAPDNWLDENGKMKTLPFCWVVEVPKNEDGEDNPHLHVLLGWRVDYRHFAAWAERLESLWGQGFAHLEKIKEAEHAGAYMAKAAGYLTKAEGQTDQGEVSGNRYWVSKPSRADGWVCEGRYQMGEMGGLIKDVHRFMQFKYGHVFKARAKLSGEAAEIRKQAKQGQATPEKKRQAVAKALQKTREFIKSLPARASEYQLIIKGEGNLASFLNWASKPYSADHTPKRLHRDGELKAFWLPVCFGVRRGWKADEPVGSKYYENLKQERNAREKQNRRTKAKSNGGGSPSLIPKSSGFDGFATGGNCFA